MKKPSIPSIPKPGADRRLFDSSVKERLEIIGGERSERIKTLDPATATAADIAIKVNEIIALLQ